MYFRKVTVTFALIVAALAAMQAVARAQSPAETNDPVARAMERIEATVERRASIADRVLTASKLLNESSAARKRGECERAEAALKQAETIIAEFTPSQQSYLADELASAIVAERAALNPRPPEKSRTHSEHSTRIAAKYLRDLYRQFGDWKLALAAYNAGEGRVQRAIEIAGVSDFNELARRKLLPLETRNYVPAVLAAWSQMSLAQAAQTMRLARKEGVK